jgi:hypothetical protein
VAADDACVICLDALAVAAPGGGGPALALGCGHAFHIGCITPWLAAQGDKRCPTCRARTGDAAGATTWRDVLFEQ